MAAAERDLDGATIEISNWLKYNPRGESKRPSWFRFENDFFFNPNFDDLDLEERMVWIFLLCQCSPKSSGTIQLKYSYIMKHCGVKAKSVTTSIKKLLQSQCLRLLARDSHETRTDSCDTRTDSHPTDGRTDDTERDGRDDTDGTNGTSAEARPSAFAPASAFFSAGLFMEQVFEEKQVKTELQEAWLKAYPDAHWVGTEVRKAIAWETANPKKKSKSFSKFMTNWLARGWEDHRKSIPSNSTPKTAGNDAALERYRSKMEGQQ